MPSKITQQDIAERAQVNRSSVSLALRDSSRISLETRRQIWSIAKATGYRPNPLVNFMMQTRRKPATQRDPVIAYVTDEPSDNITKPALTSCNYLPGATKRASELGYNLVHYRVQEINQSAEIIDQLRSTQDVRGLLIGRLSPGRPSPDLPWQKFACVALGMTLRLPSLNRVAEDYYSGTSEAMDQIYRRGYRRIGFVLSHVGDAPCINERRLAAFLVKQFFVQEKDRLPTFEDTGAGDPSGRFRAWITAHKPDALLTVNPGNVLEWLQQMDRSSTNQIGVVSLVNDRPAQKISGIDCNPDKLGSLAVEMLVDSIHRSEFGIPVEPHEILLSGVWRDGQSCKMSQPHQSFTQGSSSTER